MLAAAIKARWICEHAHQQRKEELGLDHAEGQILDRITPTCLDDDDSLRLPPVPPPQGSGTEKRVGEPPPQPSMPAIRQAILDRFTRPPIRQCPHCEKPHTAPAIKMCQSSASSAHNIVGANALGTKKDDLGPPHVSGEHCGPAPAPSIGCDRGVKRRWKFLCACARLARAHPKENPSWESNVRFHVTAQRFRLST